MKIFGVFDSIKEINEKYKTPHIKMTPMVKVSLLALRIYLLLMIVIMLYKFLLITIFKQP